MSDPNSTDPVSTKGVPAPPTRRGAMAEVWAYLRIRKRWWLAPVVVILIALGALAAFTETSALAPFIYTIF